MLHGFSKPKTPDYLRRAEAKGKMGSFIIYDLNLLRVQKLEGDHFFKLI